MSWWRKGCGPGNGVAARFFRDRRANTAIEFALVTPVLLYALLAATDFGLASWQKLQVGNAARAGAQYAAETGWSNTAVKTAAQSATSLSVSVSASSACGCAGASGIAAQTCGTNCTAGGTAPTYVTVTTSATYTPISPIVWGGNATTLTATAFARTP